MVDVVTVRKGVPISDVVRAVVVVVVLGSVVIVLMEVVGLVVVAVVVELVVVILVVVVGLFVLEVIAGGVCSFVLGEKFVGSTMSSGTHSLAKQVGFFSLNSPHEKIPSVKHVSFWKSFTNSSSLLNDFPCRLVRRLLLFLNF